MALTPATFGQTGYFSGLRTYSYRTADAHAVVAASGYFNQAVLDCNLETGSIILATVGFGGTMQLRAYVATVTNGVVTTTQLLNS